MDEFGVQIKESSSRRSASAAGGGASTPRAGRKSEVVKRLFDDGDAKQMDIALMRILQQHEKQVAEESGETKKSRRKGASFSSPGAIETPYDWIASALQSADLEALGGMEVVEALLRMPCWDRRLADIVKAHVARQRSLTADGAQYDVGADRAFGPAELFVLSVPLGVSQAQQKLKCLQFVGGVSESIQHLHAPVSRLQRACNEVLQSPRLVVLLRDVLLPAGNALNTHSSKAAASGIKLSSLPALARTRSKSNVSLLRYVAQKLVRLADSEAAQAAGSPESVQQQTPAATTTHDSHGKLVGSPSVRLLTHGRLQRVPGSASSAAGTTMQQLPSIEESAAEDPTSPEAQAPPQTPKPGTPLDSPATELQQRATPRQGAGNARRPLMRRTSSMCARKSFASVSVQDLLDPAEEIPTAMTVGRVSLD